MNPEQERQMIGHYQDYFSRPDPRNNWRNSSSVAINRTDNDYEGYGGDDY